MSLIVYLQIVLNIFPCFASYSPPKKKKNFSKKRTKELCVSDIDEILELVFLSENW